MNKKNLKDLLKEAKHEYYFRAITIHRSHKDKRLTIRKGSFLETIYKDMNPFIAIIKSSQTGISEYLIVRAITRAEMSRSILYILPTFDLKNQFVKERFDKSVNFSIHYLNLFTFSELRKFAESVSLKQIGKGSIAFVGSNTANAFISYPADDIIIDEYDQCNQANLQMAEERQSASQDKTTIYVANPTITGYGIDKIIQETDEKEWFIKHDCGHEFVPDFFKHVVEEVQEKEYVIRDKTFDWESSEDVKPLCDKCGKPFDRYSTGRWINRRVSRKSGYHISKMFSTYVTLREMVERFSKGLEDDAIMERFYNADLGLAYQPVGSKIFAYMLDACVRDYLMPDSSDEPCLIGIDVGKVLHVTIGKIMLDGIIKLMYIGIVNEETDIIELMKRYKCICGVIDANPETRLSKSLSYRFSGIFRWYKSDGQTNMVNGKKKTVNANRTEILDEVKNHVMTESLILPKNAKSIPDFYAQVTAPTRIFEEEKNRYIWDEGSAADHYCFSLAYMILAKKIMMMK